MEAYQYSPLINRRDIRLLKLHPRSQCDSIRVSLDVFNLDEVPSYNPLSYAWGDTTTSERIECDGRELRITTSLKEALHNLRHETNERVLWVDAICINQRDLAERSGQVSMMRDIYAGGKMTLIWLGPAEDGDEEVFEIIKTAHRRFVLSDHQSEKVRSAIFEMFVHPDDPDRTWSNNPIRTVLKRLEKCHWFERLWVVQEAVASAQKLVVLGPHTLNWAKFDAVCRTIVLQADLTFSIQQLPLTESDVLLAIVGIGALIRRYQRFHTSAEVTLLWALKSLSGRKVTNPYDRIYGVLGLVTDPTIRDLTVDYVASLMEVDSQAARYCLINNDPFELLALATTPIDRVKDGDQSEMSESSSTLIAADQSRTWPSWVPHFERMERNTTTTFTSTRYQFCHGGESKPTIRFAGLQNEILVIQGVRIDRVKKVLHCRGWVPDTPIRMIIPERCPWLTACRELIMQHDPYPTGEPAADVAWRVMICDRLLDGRIAAPANIAFGDDYLRPELLSFLLEGHAVDADTTTKAEKDYYVSHYDSVSDNTFISTELGYVGWGLPMCAEGDEIFLFPGSRTPFVLRAAGEKSYRLISNAYVHGVMHGEACTAELELDEVAIV